MLTINQHIYYVILFYSPITYCDILPDFDLSLWKDDNVK